jgi:RNA polymerase sigma-70 factor (ECF subfamily)
MPPDDRDLTRRAAQGDKEAFGALVRWHQSAIFNIAYRMFGDRHEAEDAAQETFVRAYRALKSYDPEKPPGPWLKRIAVNLCLNQLERRKDLPLEEDRAFSSPESGPESQTIERELSRQVRSALISLPPRYRAVIELRHYQELTYEEIAQTLHRPLSDVKSDLFRARKMLAEKITTEILK